MKINILTQPLFCNYGGILQNYALQEVLRRMGHEVLTLNVPPTMPTRESSIKEMAKTLRNFFYKVKGNYYYPFLNPYTFALKEHELSFPQREFVKKYIDKVDVKDPFTPQTAIEYPADAWIVGSDQVWRPWCSHHIENCFFDFLDEKAIKIAYAASFGTDKWEISEELTSKFRNLAKSFNGISVREASGVKLCNEFLNVNATHVLDPTMLLNAKDYLSLTQPDDAPKDKYIAAYILDNNKEKMSNAKRLAKEKGLPLKQIGQMHRDRFDSIESWLATIAHSEYVITDSFHGTVFSLIFNRPVKILFNELRGNSRLKSLLGQLRISSHNDGFHRISEAYEFHLNNYKDSSIMFLHNSLYSMT